MNVPWSHGYCVSTSYTSDYYRELAPNWLDFAVLLKGLRPPREKEGIPFQYLELGCGTGLGLCLLAGAYPEGQFVGVDFQPDHIVQALRLARQLGLKNIHFLEADFLELDKNPQILRTSDSPTREFHYIVAHGVVSWLSVQVQQALLSIVSKSLALGGLFYCSYNTYPGWLAMSNFQHMVSLERQRYADSDLGSALTAARTNLISLLGSQESPLALLQSSPRLFDELESIARFSTTYLAHEYACEHWAPLRVADMHKLCTEHKLRFISSATLPEIFDDLVADQLKPTILNETDPIIRQTLLDLATNKYFRRDVFVRGIEVMPPACAAQRLGGLRFRLLEAPSVEAYRFPTCFGEILGHFDGCHTIEMALAGSPSSLSDIQSTTGEALGDLLRALALLVHVNRIGIDRGDAADQARESSQKINQFITAQMQEGQSYSWLIAPNIGTCVSFNLVELISTQAISDGLQGDVLTAFVLMGLSSLGIELTRPTKEPISDAAEQRKLIESLVENLASQRIPTLHSLGVLPSNSKD